MANGLLSIDLLLYEVHIQFAFVFSAYLSAVAAFEAFLDQFVSGL